MVKTAFNAGDPGSIPGLGRSSGEGNGNPLQYSYRENPMDGADCQATARGIAESYTTERPTLYLWQKSILPITRLLALPLNCTLFLICTVPVHFFDL